MKTYVSLIYRPRQFVKKNRAWNLPHETSQGFHPCFSPAADERPAYLSMPRTRHPVHGLCARPPLAYFPQITTPITVRPHRQVRMGTRAWQCPHMVLSAPLYLFCLLVATQHAAVPWWWLTACAATQTWRWLGLVPNLMVISSPGLIGDTTLDPGISIISCGKVHSNHPIYQYKYKQKINKN